MASTAEISSSNEARAAKKAGFQRREAPSFPSAVEVISENRTSAWAENVGIANFGRCACI
jgi:hypothetical protein